MKKYILISISALFLIILICIIYAYNANNQFSFKISNVTFGEDSKKNTVTSSFNDAYNLSASIKNEETDLEKNIKQLTKKTTYLLLGDFNNKNETSENYYKRHQEYLDLRYNPDIPKDENTSSGFDEDSQEYKDDIVSGVTVPSIFLQLNELDIIYNSYGDIRITQNNEIIISSITLPNVKMKSQSNNNPMEYEMIETNLILYYYFKELNGEYKLYYLFGETTEDLNDYIEVLENNETKSMMAIAPTYDSNLSTIYNYDKLNNLTDEEINNIYNLNENKIVYLNAYYNNSITSSANGFFINDGLIVTTWHFLEKALIEAQYITASANNGNNYIIEGIVTANPETDVAVIKIENPSENHVNLVNFKELQVEDPAIIISSKLGSGLTVQKGIITSLDNYIQTSIPLVESDEGSPLFDKNGNVIGINTAQSTNSSLSLATNTEILKEIQDKFNNIKFNEIDAISFNELKEKYYYINYNDETIKNNIPKNKWKKYSKIGNIEQNIKLELIKANYKDNIVSLRYKNEISNYISNMQLAITFKEQLLEDGYKEVLNSSTKCIYENEEYKIIIMDEFDYLIIVMVKL